MQAFIVILLASILLLYTSLTTPLLTHHSACCVLQVREPALLAWLERKRGQGYTLLGLEQTAESVPLPRYPFPKRCVLVLGREKEGMPPEVGAGLCLACMAQDNFYDASAAELRRRREQVHRGQTRIYELHVSRKMRTEKSRA